MVVVSSSVVVGSCPGDGLGRLTRRRKRERESQVRGVSLLPQVLNL